MDIKNSINNSFLLFDGAMGTMIQRAGLKKGEIPESYNILHPEIIEEIHREYIRAGADVITTNTFGANELKLQGTGYSVEIVIGQAVRIGKAAAGDKLVALDIGPTGKLMEPMGDLKFEEAYEIFKRQVRAGAASGADLILIETISDLYEAKAAVLAAKENSNLPVFCTMTFQSDGRTLTGTDPLTMVNVLEGLGVDALGVNCSLGPEEIIPVVEEILKTATVPVMVQPNAGLPKLKDGDTFYDVGADEFADKIKIMAECGGVIFGGCCGTDPGFIKAVRDKLNGLTPIRLDNRRFTAVSSSTRTVILGHEVRVIGERINPTGNKKYKEALKNNNPDYILSEAIAQRGQGAHILDVNTGLPEIDEREMMIKAVKGIQSIVNLPLQIDSPNPDVIEAAARIYNGKPIINSVNGKAEVMEDIFPIVKKYGACVVGLTLDERGIPGRAEDRVSIAGKIIDTAASYGIPRENIIIDCLVLTASAQQKEVMETLKAVSMVKEMYGVKTTLGVSNVSFGLPQRGVLNRAYLAMALSFGLDAPIINPGAEGVMDTINAFKVLSNQDREAKKYISIYGDLNQTVKAEAPRASRDLKQLVIDGVKEEAAAEARKLLNTVTPLEIVDSYLIPALDEVGRRYEIGDIFLPQLIQSAEAVKNAFGVLKGALTESGETRLSKGKILLATVKGDVHDIGKNIVKILLENYGFEAIDLGKDVSVESIVETAAREDIRLVGLSALMTTTVKSMEDTIKALKDNNIPCKVMVGGAVLNEEYARMIGADFYARDAREGVKIAREFFGG